MRARPSPASILRQIQLLRAQPDHVRLATILDALDAWNAVETALTLAPRLLAWGPRAFSGTEPIPWVGVALWQRAPSYTGYRTLTVRGVWGVREGDADRVVIGAKLLAYAAPFYDAEAYHKLIRKGFDLYYRDAGGPPLTGRVLDEPYAEDDRLAQRARVRAALLQ